ncbi:bifunctional phosphopantothenoylcysteine decarboxylase/phosphopantothenate--cysteine ligase CoaBC [Bacillus marinisedimentorum]|uniref:bifunctional phosphopantothenoylcysteine decarboxylase/phosphopantothenate--cysteine ligase CoaBC n=1 Tax=Bacillus marinisedimentorum TaxID=1821260 RepID=UPI0007E1654A|nr:bifunctional phosphopantothenoylcysteine decarboxylase/phosphopantothenate--cysteine ligase CoaBC [Bacillus marinisedimentorum]
MMEGKNILLCVSGGIAVYKAAALASKLSQTGANVKVIMTDSARQFVSPLTFQSLSRNPVYTDTFDEKDAAVIAHIDLADWADLVIVAPATANVIGKLANGIADDMLSTTLLAVRAPVWLAPAMNVHMYAHPAVRENMDKLAERGHQFIEPGEGYLACGYTGKGRLEEPETIAGHAAEYFRKSGSLKGKKLIVTAGPTVERVDPVRFFTNRSTGKMGFAIAEEAAEQGAEVVLVSGPVSLADPPGVHVVRVETAEEMFNAVMDHYERADIVVKAAAVADYRPVEIHGQKMKKSEGSLMLEMERTKDILKTLGSQKSGQVLVGFAAESERVEEYARKKLESKNLDIIVANNINEAGSGFGSDTNSVQIYKRDGSSRELPLLAKREVAKVILAEAVELIKGKHE